VVYNQNQRMKEPAEPRLSLEELIELARAYQPTEAEKEEFRRSFAYGNVHLANPRVTREDIDRAADDLAFRPVTNPD
jgi:hypothetical protein